MIDRRKLIAGGAGLATGAVASQGCARGATTMSYDEAVQSTWATLRVDGGHRELVRYATLAANSHNTQPWRFRVQADRIIIAPDFARRCPAVDPHDHHLFASLGCAAENLVHAAAAGGLKATPAVEAEAIAIMLEGASPAASALFGAIPRRQSTRAAYDGKPVASETLRLLEQAGTGDGVSVLVITDRGKMANVIDYVVEGNTAQMRDKAFMDELKSWMRFDEGHAGNPIGAGRLPRFATNSTTDARNSIGLAARRRKAYFRSCVWIGLAGTLRPQ